jgi:Glycosyl hydrolase family 99
MKRILFVFGVLLGLGFGQVHLAFAQTSPQDPVPYLAYYYIWFTEDSWARAKTDYPTLGRYSSDDRSVMEQHVKWAQEASIKGFIVSWKATPTLNRRLELLMDVAAKANFSLTIIYQGLDFQRKPLSITQIDSDFEYFVTNYADNPVFGMYDKPIVIWSGTWEFSPAQISRVTSGYRDRMYILASERNTEGYLSLANAVDGNAYYWSSVDPQKDSRYEEKLTEMGALVHEHGGLWIAPAAPGFDARLIGGTRVIERNEGKTLRLQLNAALRSSPDMIGVISWNEFSENSHIEPSVNYGTVALDTLKSGHLSTVPQPLDFDSSAEGTGKFDSNYNLAVLGLLAGFLALTVIVTISRRIHIRKLTVS